MASVQRGKQCAELVDSDIRYLPGSGALRNRRDEVCYGKYLGTEKWVHAGMSYVFPGYFFFSATYKTDMVQEMRNYMPGPHRRFLEMLGRIAYIRPYAMSHKAESSVRDAYNTAVMALGRFRDTHIQIVTRYIIMAARMAPPADVPVQINLASATTDQVKVSQEKVTEGLAGTGGTDLIPFLKQTRDTTKAAASYTSD